MGENLGDLEYGKDILGPTPKARSMREMVSRTSLKLKTSAL